MPFATASEPTNEKRCAMVYYGGFNYDYEWFPDGFRDDRQWLVVEGDCRGQDTNYIVDFNTVYEEPHVGARGNLTTCVSYENGVYSRFSDANFEIKCTKYLESWKRIGSISGDSAGDDAGGRVSLSSDGAVVAFAAEQLHKDPTDIGYVRVMQRTTGSTWMQLGQDFVRDIPEYSIKRLALSKDGKTLALGFPGLSSETVPRRGYVRIYRRDGTEWNKVGGDIQAQLDGRDFGQAVTLSADGDTVAVGDPFGGSSNQGIVSVYQFVEGGWQMIGAPMYGQVREYRLGAVVALSADASLLVVLAPGEDDKGFVEMYTFDGISWDKVNELKSNIIGSGRSNKFGWSMALSSYGSVLAISDNFSVYIYRQCKEGFWDDNETRTRIARVDEFSKVALSSDGTVVATGDTFFNQNQGRVRLFRFDGAEDWVQMGHHIDDRPAAELTGFGLGLSNDGMTVAIGSPGFSDSSVVPGYVEVFEFSSSSSSPNPASAHWHSTSVSAIVASLACIVIGLSCIV